MPLEITVGPPQLVVHDGQTVWAAEPDGQVTLEGNKGLMFFDTRLISSWRIYANGAGWELLNGAAITHFAARVFLTNARIPTQGGEIPPHTMSLALGRWIDGGIHEDLDIVNHGMVPVRFNLEIAIRSDFADLFEVKSNRFVRRGRIATDWSEADQRLTSAYHNADFHRAVSVKAQADTPAVYANGRISFEIVLAAGAAWHGCLLYDLQDNARRYTAPAACVTASGTSRPATSLHDWRQTALKIHTGNEEFYRLYNQAVDDIVALRLPVEDPDGTHVVPSASSTDRRSATMSSTAWL